NRITKHTCGDGRKRYALQLSFASDPDAVTIAVREQLSYSRILTVYRSNRMDYEFCGEVVSLRDLRVARFAPIEVTAFLEKLWSRGPVNRAIHTSATQQTVVRRIHDSVNRLLGDIAHDDLNLGHTISITLLVDPQNSRAASPPSVERR